MLEELLPGTVACREAFDDKLPAPLLPGEESVIATAVDKRRQEFATGRRCAREALAALGFPPVAVLSGPKREPRWPDGVVGSITHCAGYRAAVVARAAAVYALGVDAEPHDRLPAGVLDRIALPEEARWATGAATAAGPVHWDRLLFSAKESVYKAWFPLTGRWLGFEEAVITVNPERGTFTARLLVPGPVLPDGTAVTGFDGRWLVRRGLLLTVIAVPALRTAVPEARTALPGAWTVTPAATRHSGPDCAAPWSDDPV